MTRLLPLLLLAACGPGASRHELRQGAMPLPVEAPAFEPAYEAPHTTGQPGYVGPVENLPRSPHGRVLPQTPKTRKEPGIWAADESNPKLLHYAFPILGSVLEVDLPSYADFVPLKRCSEAVDIISSRAKAINDVLSRRSADERACYIARTMEVCMLKRRDLYMWQHADAIRDNAATADVLIEGHGLDAGLKETRERVEQHCGGLSMDLLDALVAAWTRAAYPATRTTGDVQ